MKINIKTCRLLAAGCVALAAVGARAMPTKVELAQAQRQAQDLAAADLHALQKGTKTAGEAAAALLALADKAETEAVRYLLLQGAFKLCARGADHAAAEEVLDRISRDIADVPQELLAELAAGEKLRIAKRHDGNRPNPLSFDLGGGVKMEMVGCPAGKFYMGAKKCPKWAGIAKGHMVELTRPFWICKFPVTVGQWERLMPQIVPPHGVKREDMDARLPVQGYSGLPLLRTDAKAFIDKLTRKFRDRLPHGYVFRLPTSAEWEYALLAGKDAIEAEAELLASAVTVGDSKAYWQSRGLAPESGGDHDLQSHFPYVPVGGRPPNAWGICDMVGVGCEPVLDSWTQVDEVKGYGKIASANPSVFADGVKDPLLYERQSGYRNIFVRGPIRADYPPAVWLDNTGYSFRGRPKVRLRLVIGPDLLKERGIISPAQ